MDDYEKILAEYGLNKETYEACISTIQDKINGVNDLDWQEIVDLYNLPMSNVTLRKSCSSVPFGCKFALDYFNQKEGTIHDDIDVKIAALRKERQKLQTLNLERNRLDREESRHNLYFEYIREAIKKLPVPEFEPMPVVQSNTKEYVLCLADLHYGTSFSGLHNAYSPEICAKRFSMLLQQMNSFIFQHEINRIKVVSLGDDVQGLLRMTDLRLNDSSVVKSVVDVSRLIASFLNALSQYVYVDYYHVPTSNHSQNRNLGTKASELPWEDMEYIIGHYISDLVADNKRINVTLAEENQEYVKIPIFDFNVIAMHGHQFKDAVNAIQQMTVHMREFVDILLIGHQHSSKELIGFENLFSDSEILVCPSFVGSDPYADKLMVGAKPAVKIFGFDQKYCHTETYKFILS